MVDPVTTKEALGWFGAALAAIVGVLLKLVHHQVGDIKKTAEDALPRAEFDRVLADSLRERDDLRSDVRELFSRDDRMKDLFTQRFDDLRRDMQTGFEHLSEQIRDGKK